MIPDAGIDAMFSIRVDQPVEDLVIVVVIGEIDSLTAPRLSMRLHHELESEPPSLVLDLTGVAFLGVAGLQVLDCVLARTKTLPTILTLVYDDQSPVASALRAGTLTECFPSLA